MKKRVGEWGARVGRESEVREQGKRVRCKRGVTVLGAKAG